MLRAQIACVCIWVLCGVCSICKKKGVRQRNNTADSNDPNMYVGDVVAVFKLLLGLTPQRKIFTPPPPRRCAGAAQPYTRLCVCSGSLLTQSKWNINSSCQVPGLYRVEVQRPISSSPNNNIIHCLMSNSDLYWVHADY